MKRSGPPARRTPLKAKAPITRDRALSPAAPPKARKRLRRRSKKAEAAAEARRDVVMAVHARDRYCVAERAWPDVACGGRLDVHEPLPRSRGGDPLDADQAVLLCRRAHDWVHDNPLLAQCAGLTIPTWVAERFGTSEATRMGAELRYALRCGDPAFAPWLSATERDAISLSDLRWIHGPPLAGG